MGKGVALRQLRDAIAQHPEIRQNYLTERAIELDNLKQRNSMMWVKDANSRVRTVDTEFRELCTYTNPMHVRQVPDRRVVAHAKEVMASQPKIGERDGGNILAYVSD